LDNNWPLLLGAKNDCQLHIMKWDFLVPSGIHLCGHVQYGLLCQLLQVRAVYCKHCDSVIDLYRVKYFCHNM